MRIVLCFFAEAAGVFKNNSATKKVAWRLRVPA
jgi:hypothetical protein